MKILFLAHRIPYPPNKGDKIRSFHEVKHLSLRHELHLMAFYDHAEDLRSATGLDRYCRSVTLLPMNPLIQKVKAGLSMLMRRPWSLGYFSNRRMAEAVRAKLEEQKFDLIFVYCSSMAQYVESLDGIPKILDLVDSDACKWQQYAALTPPPVKWLYGYESRRLKQYEIRMLDVFGACTFVSPREAMHLPERRNANVAFIRNGIDQEFYQPAPISPSSRDIVFTGAMDYFPNVDAVTFFAVEVFPKIRRMFGDARFVIVGSRPDARVRKLAAAPGVVVTGSVPDVRPYLAQARVAVAPLRIAQGIQNKVLEALAAGLPVIASPAAAAGLVRLKDVPLAVAHGPASFVRLVADCLRRPPLTSGEVLRCRKELQKHYDWSANMNEFETAIEALFDRDGAARSLPAPAPRADAPREALSSRPVS